MTSEKTPTFTKALSDYFSNLVLDEKGGQWRTCRFSGERFTIRSEDIAFYKRLGVPLPTLSPKERFRRRSAQNNSYNLFKGVSGFSGKRIVTTLPPGSPFIFYEHQAWHSDGWDASSYGRVYDSDRAFFDAFHELRLAVPRPNLISDPANMNSDYSNVSSGLKNCYIVFDQNKGENLYYHQCCSNDKNCVDCWALDECDTCYACKLSQKLYNCYFCEQCTGCMDSFFLWDCRNSSHCFMSSGLRNKEYYFRNKYVGKEEYNAKIKEIRTGNYEILQQLIAEYDAMKERTPRKPSWNERSVNIVGDYIKNSQNIYHGLYITNSENLAYSSACVDSHDCYDVTGALESELCYEMSNIGEKKNYRCIGSLHIERCSEVEYSDLCSDCQNCFGCVGLSHKAFCIFNVQYTEQEYWKKVDEIKTAMLARGEYGEFFPPQHSPFPYRISMSASYAGFRDFDNAARYGYDTTMVEEDRDMAEGDTVRSSELSGDIKDVSDDVCAKVILDEENNKQFRIIPQELAFYRAHELPLPREHPSVRMQRWRDTFNLYTEFYERACPKCGTSFETTYAPERPELVYCEECYQKEIV